MDAIKIAIIGAGNIGLRHAQSVVNCKTTQLLCFVDPRPLPSTRKAVENYGVLIFDSISAMLDAGYVPDGAIVCTPNSTHVDLSKQLLSKQVHVLVEKPISTDIRSGKELVDTARDHGKQLLVGHHRRFNPYITATRNAISRGSIGTPIAISGLWMLCKPNSYFDPPTQWRASAEGGGPILINMIHEVDVLQYLLGPIVRVHAEQTLSQRNHEVEEGAAILLRFSSGVVGTFLLCDATPSKHNFESATGENPIIPRGGSDCYRIFGTNGSLSVGDMMMNTYPPESQKSWSTPLYDSRVEVQDAVPFDAQVVHFAHAVLGKEQPRCNGEDGLSALAVCEAIRRAMRTGYAVEINL